MLLDALTSEDSLEKQRMDGPYRMERSSGSELRVREDLRERRRTGRGGTAEAGERRKGVVQVDGFWMVF